MTIIARHASVHSRAILVAGLAFAAMPALAQEQPIRRGNELIFPEGAPIPAGLTDVEREFLKEFPISPADVGRMTTPPPAGPIRCPGEYEPMQGILLAWEQFTPILTNMIRQITTTGNAQAYIMVDSASEQATVANSLAAAGGINLSRVSYFTATTDTVWIRDYGPRYIYEGGVRAVVDHIYNRPRPNDDTQPTFWSNVQRRPYYGIPLIHGGGNFHLNGLGDSFATRLINNENPGLTESQIINHWLNYQNVQTGLFTPFSTAVDSTQHIDMWMQVYADNAVMISDWPTQSGSSQDVVCDSTAAFLAGQGWTVTRIPAVRSPCSPSAHYTYTNVVMCNDLVLVPTFTAACASGLNAQALTAWQNALPGKTIVGIDCQSMITSAGVMHCICMHVPKSLGAPAPGGGQVPVAYLRTQRTGVALDPGQIVDIRWITDDDVQVVNVDIELSIDGGSTWPTVIAAATVDDGLFSWTVPDIYTQNAKVRVVARDNQGNTGFDASPIGFAINAQPPACPGDADGDGLVGLSDIAAVITGWGQMVPEGTMGDLDGDGLVGLSDISVVNNNWGATCP